ncbi:hypothetical protein LSH36_402g02023 [Paralvinella palmiformis]|uniref:Uncharacterized protein n=1 Tax=Paralvinella palmiformis TaxID=53620 RepID=A0AAD9JDV0_9ANNE|nr:hypothetical protein LSH36_402g02023 [Paralvinella palmiformis]
MGMVGDYSGTSSPTLNIPVVYKIGIYGWRKRCLYIFMLLIMVTVIVNLALTVWILKVMDFSIHGMGHLRIESNGIRVEGDSEFLRGLYASSIRSQKGASLSIQSAQNITLNARDKNGKLTNRLVLEGDLLFSADKDKVQLGSSTINVAGPRGATFQGSVQTPVIRSKTGSLRLESPTRSLDLSAPEGVTVQAEQGPVRINSGSADIKIESYNQVSLEAKSIRLKSLSVSEPTIVDSPFQEVYQLCICAQSGKLFLSPAQGNCQATGTICN